jgi:circadian clock protein KaiB
MNDTLPEERFTLRLYIAGQTPRSLAALANLSKLCEEFLPGRYDLEVIDLILHPKRARTDQILAIPTLVRSLPVPIARIIGDLSDTDQVLLGLNIQRKHPS